MINEEEDKKFLVVGSDTTLQQFMPMSSYGYNSAANVRFMKSAFGIIVMYELTRILIETVIGDSMKNLMLRILGFVFCCKKRNRREPKAYVTAYFRADSKVHLYCNCETFRRSGVKPREHDICTHCQRLQRQEAQSLPAWEIEQDSLVLSVRS